MKPLKVRNGLAADVQKVSEIHIKAWQSAYRGLLPDQMLDQLSLDRRINGWKMILDKNQGQLSVLEAAETLVGFVHIQAARDKELAAEKVGEITSIYLEPDCIGLGYGKALLNHAVEQLSIFQLKNEPEEECMTPASGWSFIDDC
ncbi:GNAT family N-acetyltransferase [Endozoicomonas arenosclerae]|uniref:GNAT family N-acetyltransferase n=1 Tax=Endozoicomonas arenosclerae TaxID=1633495 RepID=UPI0007814DCE|nr:GNAT family N-acetyltransferase [Endozoicomonas arenosclerae]